MSDQPISNQPTLSPEEELDILEAVYKIGKEKGLDLLRPEQVRKLTEAGRMRNDDRKVSSTIAENVTKHLLTRVGGNSAQDMEMKDKKELFKKTYGTDPAHFYLNLENHLAQVVRNNG